MRTTMLLSSIFSLFLLVRFSDQATLEKRPESSAKESDEAPPPVPAAATESDEDDGEARVENVPSNRFFYSPPGDDLGDSSVGTSESEADPHVARDNDGPDVSVDARQAENGDEGWLAGRDGYSQETGAFQTSWSVPDPWQGSAGAPEPVFYGGHDWFGQGWPGAVYDHYHQSQSFRSRARRSVDDYSGYWHSVMGPSKELEKRNVGYRMKNDLRARLENPYRPLHYGNIYTGYLGDPTAYNVNDRPFGAYSDFNLPQDINAFKYRPYGQRLTSDWREADWPVFSHNIYVLREDMDALGVDKYGVTGPVLLSSGGFYQFKFVSKEGDLVFRDVMTKQTYIHHKFFNSPEQSRKFQALGPWADPGGRYYPVTTSLVGDAYIIKGSPTTTNDPMRGNEFLYNGLPGILPSPERPTLDPSAAHVAPQGITFS